MQHRRVLRPCARWSMVLNTTPYERIRSQRRRAERPAMHPMGLDVHTHGHVPKSAWAKIDHCHAASDC